MFKNTKKKKAKKRHAENRTVQKAKVPDQAESPRLEDQKEKKEEKDFSVNKKLEGYGRLRKTKP